jgi:RNA-binding protein
MAKERPPVWIVVVFEDWAAVQNITGGITMTDVPSSIKRQAMDRNFQPSVRIGKTGVTDNIVEEIIGQLNKRKLVKIKINKGIYERADKILVWEHLAKETSSILVLSRGNVGVLWSR